MSQYRRLAVPGGTIFFALRLQDRNARLLVERIDLLRMAMRLCKDRWPFDIEEAVVLPNQMHVILTLPQGDADFSKRWRLIKSVFSRHVDRPAVVRDSMQRRGEKGIWQRRFWEHQIRDKADYRQHRDFLLLAPVREGLVARAEDWQYSSIHRTGGMGRVFGAVVAAE